GAARSRALAVWATRAAMVLPGAPDYPVVMADIFDVIAEPTRRQLLRRLAAGGEAAVGDLVESLGVTQPTVSKHLAVLREAELVTVREDGRNRYYAVRPAPLEEVDEFLTAVGGN